MPNPSPVLRTPLRPPLRVIAPIPVWAVLDCPACKRGNHAWHIGEYTDKQGVLCKCRCTECKGNGVAYA